MCVFTTKITLVCLINEGCHLSVGWDYFPKINKRRVPNYRRGKIFPTGAWIVFIPSNIIMGTYFFYVTYFNIEIVINITIIKTNFEICKV